MAETFEVYSLREHEKWHQRWLALPDAVRDVYFSAPYYQVIERNGDGTAECVYFQCEYGEVLYPYVRNSLADVAFFPEGAQYSDIRGAYGYNGHASPNQSNELRNSFAKAFGAHCEREGIIAEFTRFHPLLANHAFAAGDYQVFHNRDVVQLDLTQPYDTIWEQQYTGKNRNMIRKARKLGVTVDVLEADAAAYKYFQELYHQSMQRVGASSYYFFGDSYFDDFVRELGDMQRLLVAKVDGKIIGGQLLMMSADFAHYHLSARDPEFGKYAISNVLLDAAVQVAQQQDCKQMLLGGGNSPEPSDPLFKFKASFSKLTAPFYLGEQVHNKAVYNAVCEAWKAQFTGDAAAYDYMLTKYRVANPS